MSMPTYNNDDHGAVATPRNATGLYAGQDAKKSRYQAGAPAGPPVALSRGKPFLRKTPMEQLRQVHIENIREQKTYRGFMGSKVKMLQRPKTGANFIVTGGQRQLPSWEELHQISRRSLGPSSAAAHDEVRGRSAPPQAAAATVELLSRELERTAVHEQLAGLHDCYRRVCKGSTRSLFALLVGSSRRHIATTGGSLSAAVELSCPSFSVRGYGTQASGQNGRQSGSAHASAPRPSTAGSGRSLLVPQPLFFKRFIDPYKVIPTPTVAATTVPAAAALGHQDIIGTDQVVQELEQEPPDDMRRVTAASPSLLSPQLRLTESTGATHELPHISDGNDTQDSIRPRSQSPAGCMSRHNSPSRAERIGINVETDDGDAAPPEIDDVDDDEAADASEPVDEPVLPTNLNVRRQSITERLQKLRLGEFVANAIKEEAEERKKVLKDLMSEHEYLVKIVNNTGGSIVLH